MKARLLTLCTLIVETRSRSKLSTVSLIDKITIETFNRIIDCLDTELRKRQQAYSDLHEMFVFMTDFTSMFVDELRARARNLVVVYSSDLEESFADDFVHFMFHVVTEADQRVLHVNEMEVYFWLLSLMLVLLCGHISPFQWLTVRGERSFTTLSREKYHLRTTTNQRRLQALSLMCIESEVLRSIDFNDSINDFANRKTSQKGHMTCEKLKKLVLTL